MDSAEEMIPFVVIGVWKDFSKMDGVLLGPGDPKVTLKMLSEHGICKWPPQYRSALAKFLIHIRMRKVCRAKIDGEW